MATHKGYSIEQERDGSFSAYSLTNSMYDCHHGYRSIEAAKLAIDERDAYTTRRFYAAEKLWGTP